MGIPVEIPLPASSTTEASLWLERFHRGDMAVLEGCYREHFAIVVAAIGGILTPVDRETVVHELFSRLIAREDLRRSFRGGSFPSWLATVARNQAIDYRRRLSRESEVAISDEAALAVGTWELAAEARLLVERFRRDCLPPAWQGVFELRFLAQLPQREAARQLSMRRTTLAYREVRIRRLLKRFLLEEDET